uniref:Uncharacterized protein n=1 Tax=Anguilla anguilla TaxID=7936 RepID=A0A0E9STU6_ANGAN
MQLVLKISFEMCPLAIQAPTLKILFYRPEPNLTDWSDHSA